MDQAKIAGMLIEEMESDGLCEDLEVLTLLDYMAILGIQFAWGDEARAAYYAAIGCDQHG